MKQTRAGWNTELQNLLGNNKSRILLLSMAITSSTINRQEILENEEFADYVDLVKHQGLDIVETLKTDLNQLKT